jgi:hypothetical protein
MAYALGRRVEYGDQPAIRTITTDATAKGHRMSAYILGVVQSDAFRMTRTPLASADRAREAKRVDGSSGTR